MLMFSSWFVLLTLLDFLKFLGLYIGLLLRDVSAILNIVAI